MQRKLSWLNSTTLTLGMAFFYLPILILILFSFNEGRLVTVWTGFSTKWYGEVLRNEALISAAWITFRIALLSASIAVVLGTAASIVMVRMGRFRGKTLFSGMIYAPLVMPEVITGLSLLLLFVSMDVARGYWTITLAHITFNMAFVTVIVTSRLVSFDNSLEEAALDLGCTPASAFRQVTLPIITPSIVSGWLLAFVTSLDDLVIASFTSGPGSTTLPMKLYSSIRRGVSPEINALSTMLLCVVISGVIISAIVDKRRSVRIARDEQLARADNEQPTNIQMA